MHFTVTNAGRAPMDYLAQAATFREEAEQAEDANNDRLAHRLRALAIECEARAYRVERELKRRAQARRRSADILEVFGR
jgi:hypothetical protein